MEVGRHRGLMASEHITVGSNSYEQAKPFKYSGSLLKNQNSIHEEITSSSALEVLHYFSNNLLI